MKLQNHFKKLGNIIIISAPSGTGKTTVSRFIVKHVNDIIFSVSYTTRPKREGEVNGKDYIFVDRKKFNEMIKKDKFIEWAEVHGNYYGTPKDAIQKVINNGKDILLDIDVQGAKNVKKLFPNSISIYLLPPSLSVLKRRLMGRKKDSIETIEKRIKNAKKELAHAKYYDYIVINDKLKETVENLMHIIFAERLRNKQKIK